uniref:Calcium/calmodulin-dependent protein kinase type 1G n=1 Tax=Schistosoma haematobium TaxID=6185 RepID=A0A095C6Z9_SCHHA
MSFILAFILIQHFFSDQNTDFTRLKAYEASDIPIPKTRRLSLRSKRSFDCSFELWDENYFSMERKVSQLEGVHYAAFNVNKEKRESSPELVHLIEDQQVTCLDADNPDNWVVRVHPFLQNVNSFNKQTKKDNTLTDSQTIDENDTNDLVEVIVSNSQESQRTCEIKKIGRAKAVCLTRNLKSAQRGKRNPRESFREDVISFSNKQQESRMKLRYTLTELCDTELEYSRALKQLSDILDSLNGKIILNYSDNSEKILDYPKPISDNIKGLQDTLKRIIQFCGMFLEKLPLYSSDPGKSAESFTKTTDIKIGQHKSIQLDQNEMRMERLILLPDHLLSLKKANENNSVYCWKVNRIINLDELRIGEYGNDGNDETSFELWNISGEAPIKLVFRITCPNIISRNAWVEDIRYAIKEKQDTNIPKSIVGSHIEAYWNSKKRFSGIMELPSCPSESISEMYFDAMENVQQINSQNVHASQLSQIDKCEMIKRDPKELLTTLNFIAALIIFFTNILIKLKNGCEKASFNQKSTSSSSYYTAEEPIDEIGKGQAPSTNLFESYSTLDGVQTPFSEDQQSLADFQMSPENRGNQTQPLTTTSTNMTGTDTLAKQLTVNAGEQIQFNASFTITGPVAYETTWYMNGEPMKPDIGAEMILSDRDTRLLISNADPLIHSGTYSCRCRLFEGTETAVYFCVNILTAKLDRNDTNDNESDQLKLTNFMQADLFHPITKELDLPIGKLLEIQVKIDEETVLKQMENNNKENIQVNWYQNSTLIEPSSTCEMLKIDDQFILRSTTNNLQPDKLYNYKCMLRLPENSSMSPAPSITIPVSFHCPTVKELETEFKNCIDKNKATVENNRIFEVKLGEDDAFQLNIPIQHGSHDQDFVVWWTHEDELLTGDHLPSKESEYNCSLELSKKSNEMIAKLSKTPTGTNDCGIYKCWTVSQSLKDNIVRCTNVAVTVRQEEATLSEKSNDKEKEKEAKNLQGDKISMVDGVETNLLNKEDEEINREVPSMKKEEEEKKRNAENIFKQEEQDLKKRESEETKRKEEEIVRLRRYEEEASKKRVEEEGKNKEVEETAMKRKQKKDAESKRKEVELRRKEEEIAKMEEEEIERKRKEVEDAESKRKEEVELRRKERKVTKMKKEEAETDKKQKDGEIAGIKKEDEVEKRQHKEEEDERLASHKADKEEPITKTKKDYMEGKEGSMNKTDGKGYKKESKEGKDEKKKKLVPTKDQAENGMKTKPVGDVELKPESETSQKKNIRGVTEQTKDTGQGEEIKTVLETDSEMKRVVGEFNRGEKDSEENKVDVRVGDTAESLTDEKREKGKNKVEKSDEIQTLDKGKRRRGSRSTWKDDNKDSEKLVGQITVENEVDRTKQTLEKEDRLDDQNQKEVITSEAEEFPEHHDEKDKNKTETVKAVHNQITIDFNNSESTSQNKQTLIDQVTNSGLELKSVKKDKKKEKDGETGHETKEKKKSDGKIGMDNTESIVSTEYPTENHVNNKPESFKDYQQINTESFQKPQRRESKAKKHGKDTKKNRSVADTTSTTTTTTGNDEDLAKDYIKNKEENEPKTQMNLVGVEIGKNNQEVLDTMPTTDALQNEAENREKQWKEEKKKKREKSKNVDKENEDNYVSTRRQSIVGEQDPNKIELIEDQKQVEKRKKHRKSITEVDKNDVQCEPLKAEEKYMETNTMDDDQSEKKIKEEYKGMELKSDLDHDHEDDNNNIFSTELLSKYICKQGETLKLAVELKNNVFVKYFEWLVNEKMIDPESTADFVVWQTGNWIALTIPNVRPDLTGTYKLRVVTPSGEYYTTGDLSVNGQKLQTKPYIPSQVEGLKPLFTKKLQDYTAEVNETVRFSGRLVAEPPATIIWKHNGIQIENNKRIEIYNDNINPLLIIQNVKDEDYGTLYEPNSYEHDTTEPYESTARPTRCSVLPSRVSNIELIEVNDDGFKIAWDPLNEQVTYNVEISNDAGRWWKPVLTNLHEVSAYISNDIACPLNPVQVRIVAENEFGLGPPCFPVLRLPIRACLPHMQAVKPEVESEEATAIKIRWCPAVPALTPNQLHKNVMLNPSQLLGKVTYAVEIREGSQSEWCRVASDIPFRSYTCHLRPGISSAIRIVAKNRYGESCPTPMAIVQLDPNSLVPDLSLDPPWIAISHPGDNITVKKSNIRLLWKPAYMPEFCTSCVKGLKPLYRVEWRRGLSGHWVDLACGISECETGYPLPRDLVESVIRETHMGNDLSFSTANSNSSIEFRIFSYNDFGESGPTKSYRLKASQISRGQDCRKNSQISDKINDRDQYDHLSLLDKLPIISSSKIPRREVQMMSIDPKLGVTLKWDRCTSSDINKSSDDHYNLHGRYRIQRKTSNDADSNSSPDMSNWTVVCREDDLIHGEQYVLDVKPGKTEQFVRILSLQEDKEGNLNWLDTHEILRIPALHEICPPAPLDIEVKLTPPVETSGSAGVRVTWKPPNFELPLNDNYLTQIKNHAQIDYRIEARTTLSDLAPWRQIGIVSGLLGSIDDHKAEPGSQLIYRITPINQFGEGPSSSSYPIKLPLLLTTLERCIEDFRFLILGSNTIQLRWRLGDTVIDALGFRRNPNQSYNMTSHLDTDESAEICERVKFSIERRDGYAGDWYPIREQINGNLHNKIILSNFEYLDKEIACRIIANVDGQQTKPSRPINISIKTDFLVPDFSAFKPHFNVTSVEEYLISWDDPDIQSLYTSHILNLSIPQVLQKDTTYAIQIQHEGSIEWTTIASNLDTNQWTWIQPNPLIGYHVRILPSNQFGFGHPTRNVLIPPQVIIPDLTFMRPSVESPSDILIGRAAPELVWQIPKSYTLDRTFTPYTFEVQIKAVEKSINRETNDVGKNSEKSKSTNNENIWRVLASGLKRNRLSLEHLNPEQEYWLRIVAVTEYGRGTPSQPVRKMADLTATSPSFTDPETSVIYAPIYGQLELKCTFSPVNGENETRFNWYFDGKLLDTNVNTIYPTLNQKFYNTVSKSGDTAVLHLNGLSENDFGSYICKAVHILGTSEKEFIVKMADAPVFLEVPTPLLTVKLHSRFELPCYIDALPPPTIIWTRDSKRIVESHRTKIGKAEKQSINKTPRMSNCEFSTDATLSVEKCIYQDSGLYTLTAENIAGRIMTSCLIHVEENPTPTKITLRWTNIEKHYFVLRRLESDSFSETHLLIDKKTNREYIGKLFKLNNPISRINGAREMECLTRLCHKNVLQLIDAFISDNVLILVYEKLSGSNLLDSVLACENWSEMGTAAVIRSILEALEHIHNQGVVHYDIQPENLLFVKKTIDNYDCGNSSDNPDLLRALASLVTDVVSQTDRHKMNVFSNLLKVTGFSAAQTYNTNSQNCVTCVLPLRYRPEYVSPEILLLIQQTNGTVPGTIHTYSENLGPPSDIWSLGVLTYILLAGWPPFIDYETGSILTDDILQAIIPFDVPEMENISNEGKDFISQLLQADPTKRPSAKECLSHPWIQIFSHSENKSEYILKKLKKYKEFYNSIQPVYIISDEKNYNSDLKNHLASMIRQPTPSEDTESVLSSRSSSILGLRESSEPYSESQSQLLDRYEAHDFIDERFIIPPNTNIPTADDASEIIEQKFNLQRQNTLTEATSLEESTYTLIKEQEKSSVNPDQENQPTSVKRNEIGNKFSVPVFASLLRDAYFSIHTREVRFTCQLASAPYLPEGISDYEEIISEIYPTGLNFNKITSSSAAAAWYLDGCLLSDGPGVSLGVEQGGWLWLCLSDLRPEQDRSVIECVVRNRAGKSRTKARLLFSDMPKPPGRPGLIDIRPTEALISWLSSTSDSNEDLIYRLDIKYSERDNEPPSWHRLGFTVDCRYLTNNLKPGVYYRVRVSARNSFGWGNYSIASSDFRTPIVSMDQSPTILSPNERTWIFNWRQSANIYALSDHPIALQYAIDQPISVPPPPDKILQELNRYNGIIPSLDVLKSICRPICLINKGTYTKLILGKTHPMLNEGVNFNNVRHQSISLPPRLLSKITYLNLEDNNLLKKARREALMLTILHGSCGGTYSSFEDFYSEQHNSYLYTNQRQLLPSGWSTGWLEDDAVKPTRSISVMQWIPGGRLIDVLCGRVEYTEFSVMMWSQQILSALKWFYACFLGQPHGNICPEHILVARRTSSLPDIVLTGFGHESVLDETNNYFSAPELCKNKSKSMASDLWSVGAVMRLLLTGENPNEIDVQRKNSTSDESIKQQYDKTKIKQSNELSSTINSENTLPTYSRNHLNIKKLKRFSKPARKFIYNCLNPSPRKRGTVDFWLNSHWFNFNADNVNNLTSVIIPTNLLRSCKLVLDQKTNVDETEELQFP